MKISSRLVGPWRGVWKGEPSADGRLCWGRIGREESPREMVRGFERDEEVWLLLLLLLLFASSGVEVPDDLSCCWRYCFPALMT